MYYTFNVIHRVTSQVENLKNKVDGLEGENNDIRKEVEKLKNDKLEQDQEHSYRVFISIFILSCYIGSVKMTAKESELDAMRLQLEQERHK